MQDYVAKAMAYSGQVRIFAAVTTHTVDYARQIHEMNPTPSVALGRLLTGAALMSQTLKGEDDTITIQVRGDGPIGGIVVVTDAKAGVRGYAYNPFFDIPLNEKGKFDIGGAVGKGYLNVIKDMGLREPYVGYVDLVSGEIAEDLTYYYAYSEQTPTVINLGVLIGGGCKVEAAGGFFIQLLPDAEEEIIGKIEKAIGELEPITTLIHQGRTPEDIIKLIVPDDEVEIYDNCEVHYECYCSRERMERNLISLGKKELLELGEDENGAELQCHFCNKKYHFAKSEILSLVNMASRE